MPSYRTSPQVAECYHVPSSVSHTRGRSGRELPMVISAAASASNIASIRCGPRPPQMLMAACTNGGSSGHMAMPIVFCCAVTACGAGRRSAFCREELERLKSEKEIVRRTRKGMWTRAGVASHTHSHRDQSRPGTYCNLLQSQDLLYDTVSAPQHPASQPAS